MLIAASTIADGTRRAVDRYGSELRHAAAARTLGLRIDGAAGLGVRAPALGRMSRGYGGARRNDQQFVRPLPLRDGRQRAISG